MYDAGVLKGSLGVTKLSPDQWRIRELERELAIAKMERDILKKASVRSTDGCNTRIQFIGRGAKVQGFPWALI